MKIKTALISVSNKNGLVDFARQLQERQIEIISTGGTAQTLKEAGVKVSLVSEITGFPEILNGRVKTLHPKVHGGILAVRDKDEHLQQLYEHNIKPIDLVVVNLYPFQETIKKENISEAEAIENIDIGGPTLIRAAAKNMAYVTVVVNPERYGEVIADLDKNQGEVSPALRRELAVEAFKHTADYDEAIYEYFAGSEEFPGLLKLVYEKVFDLRYGENPHQKASFYRDELAPPNSLVYAEQLHGQELSFNNILDFNAGWHLVNEFSAPAAVVVKHNNPCGVAVADSPKIAFELAFAADSLSGFGGIVALNQPVYPDLAEKLVEPFLEGIIAPGFMKEALEILTQKKNLRLLAMPELPFQPETIDIKRVQGGILIQQTDTARETKEAMKVVTENLPSTSDWDDLIFAWKVAKHVKSNAIVLANNKVTTGIGAGQMSRVDATELAIKKADAKSKNSVLASDAFFPFADAIEAAAKAGVRAIIQPGGSIRDAEVIAAANKYNIAMVFTGVRHFKH